MQKKVKIGISSIKSATYSFVTVVPFRVDFFTLISPLEVLTPSTFPPEISKPIPINIEKLNDLSNHILIYKENSLGWQRIQESIN